MPPFCEIHHTYYERATGACAECTPPEVPPVVKMSMAAPDLFASCQEMYAILFDGMTADYDHMTAALGRARAALIKAGGVKGPTR